MPNKTVTPSEREKQRKLALALRAQAAAKAAMTPEFEQQYKSLLGNVGVSDPAMLRLHDAELNLHGYAVAADSSQEHLGDLESRYGPWGLTVEPNTVNAVGKENWRPELVAHEFRHLQKPEYSELDNRYADAAVAQTEPQWESAARMYADYMDNMKTPSEGLPHMFNGLGGEYGAANREYDRQYDLGARPAEPPKWWEGSEKFKLSKERYNRAQWPKQQAAYEQYVDWNEGLKARNTERRLLLEELRKKKR